MARSGSKRRSNRDNQNRDDSNIVQFPHMGVFDQAPAEGDIHPMIAELIEAGIPEEDIARLVANLHGADVGMTAPSGIINELRMPRRTQPVRYQLRLDLADSKPPIWRRLEVPSDIELQQLHWVIQVAFNWDDYHLWRFSLGRPFSAQSQAFVSHEELEEDPEAGVPADTVTLDELLVVQGDRADYVYDYGDNWHLKIKLEKVSELPDEAFGPICTGGRRAAPPEDCGHLLTAQELATVLDDPAHFDKDEVNEVLVEEVTLLLMWAATAMALTEQNALLERMIDLGPPLQDLDFDSDWMEQSLAPLGWLLKQAGTGIAVSVQGEVDDEFLRSVVGEFHRLGATRASQESINQMVFFFEAYGLITMDNSAFIQTPIGSLAESKPDFLWELLESFPEIALAELDLLIFGAATVHTALAESYEELVKGVAASVQTIVARYSEVGDPSESMWSSGTPLPLTILENLAYIHVGADRNEAGIPTAATVLAVGWLGVPTEVLSEGD